MATVDSAELQQALALRRIDSLAGQHSALVALWGSSRQAAQTLLVLSASAMGGMFSIYATISHLHSVLLCVCGMLMSACWLGALLRTYEAMKFLVKDGCTLEIQLAKAMGKTELVFPNPGGLSAEHFENLPQNHGERQRFVQREAALEAGDGTPQFFTELTLRKSWAEAMRIRAEKATASGGHRKTWEGRLWGGLATACRHFHALLPCMFMVAWLVALCSCRSTCREASADVAGIAATAAAREQVSAEAAVNSDADAYSYSAYEQEGDRHLPQHWRGRGSLW